MDWWTPVRDLLDVGGRVVSIGVPLIIVGYILYWFISGKDPD